MQDEYVGQEVLMNMNLVSEKEVLSKSSQIIRLSGELDIHSAPEFKEEVLSLMGEGFNTIIIDLDELHFMDSRGLGTFIGLSRSLKEKGGSLKLVCSNQTILKIFQRTGLSDIFRLFGNRDEAMSDS
jgi:anti-sigma B factor antagonist